MLLHPPAGSARRAWWAVAGWVTMLYVGVFYARAFQELVARTIGRNAFMVVAAGVVLVGLLWLVRALRRSCPSARVYAAAVLTAAVYLGGVWHLRQAPEEAMHLLEYGGLSLLVFRALAFSVRDPLIYLSAALFCGLVGTGDEVLQWAAPRRAFDFRDITINVLSGSGLQVLLALALRPAWIRRPVSARSWAVAGALLGAWSLLLLGCLNNSLDRQARYAARFPWLPASLRVLNDPMVEYGYLHRGPDGLSFYSRLRLDQLARSDAARGAEIGAQLAALQTSGRPDRLLGHLSPASDPFLYELDVHLFRRNRYAYDALRTPHNPAAVRAATTVAYREDQILERHFPRSLAAARQALRPHYRALLDTHADRTTPHTSAVSSQLITRFTAAQATAALGSLTIAAWAFALYHARRKPSDRAPVPTPVSRP